MEGGNRTQYMIYTAQDEQWGMVCTTVGYQKTEAGECYPSATAHPSNYVFTYSSGRILTEYQLVYVVAGSGVFESTSCPRCRVSAGTILFLFPGEWHRYSPDPDSGWTEYWVGFRGANIDQRVTKGFFSKTDPVIYIGNSVSVENCYHEIIRIAREERANYQFLVSSIVLHILAAVIYKKANKQFEGNPVAEKIDRARMLFRDRINENISPESVADELGMGYTWFRRNFRNYVGVSPAQYILNIKYIKAKELLSNTAIPITDIAYDLGFEMLSHFSTFFKAREGISPREYRSRHIVQ